MGGFNNNNRFGGNRGGQRSGGRGGGGRSEMYDAVCADCGKDCKVPFRPSGSKPVYCSNCFENHDGLDRGSRDSDRRPERSERRPRFNDRGRSSGGNEAPRVDNSQLNKELLQQLKDLNYKMDKLIKVMESNSEVKVEMKADKFKEESVKSEDAKSEDKKKSVKKETKAVEKTKPVKKSKTVKE